MSSVWPFVVVRDRRVAGWIAALVVSHGCSTGSRIVRPALIRQRDVRTGVVDSWAERCGELAMLAAGVWAYSRATRARDGVGRRSFAAFVGFLLAAYAASLGPSPASITVLVVSALVGAGVLLGWALWFDRHRLAIT